VSILKERKAIDSALDDYRNRLDVIAEQDFDLTPPGGGWSYAEVYSHIMQATLTASVAAERCTHATSKPVKGGLSLVGRLVLLSGRFPPWKVKTPEAIAAKIGPQKITKEDAKNLIVKCRKRMEDVISVLKDSASKRRAQHPRLGMLDSSQWLKFIRIHLQHHLKQLKRIDANLNK
jgi:hypothetical protein